MMSAKFSLWLLTSLLVASLCCGFLDFQINGDDLLGKLKVGDFYGFVGFGSFNQGIFVDNFYLMVGDPSVKGYEDMRVVPGDECRRDCRGSKPKICHFEWKLRFFQTMNQ